MNSRTTRRFRELLAALPAHVQRQAQEAYRLIQTHPAHPGLHFKKVLADPPTYSTRVGIGYRALGVLEGGTIIWFWIGSHAEYDRLLEQLLPAFALQASEFPSRSRLQRFAFDEEIELLGQFLGEVGAFEEQQGEASIRDRRDGTGCEIAA